MTWLDAPPWVQELGRSHSQNLRDAIVALKRDDADFRRMALSVGETCDGDIERDCRMDWRFNLQDLAEAGEEKVNEQLVAQRTHEAYLETLDARELSALLHFGKVRGSSGATTRICDVLPSTALSPQIKRVARLMSRSEVEEALHELDKPDVAAHYGLVPLGPTTTSGELRELVVAVLSAHEAMPVTRAEVWDRLVRVNSYYRVRAQGSAGQPRVLFSPSRCGTVPGDDLLDSDLLCASDARAILRGLVPPLNPRHGNKFLLIPYGTLLGQAARLVRDAMLTVPEAVPLLHVVASELDTGAGKPIAAALQRAIAPVTQHQSRMQAGPTQPPHPAAPPNRHCMRLICAHHPLATRRPTGGQRCPRLRANSVWHSSARAAPSWNIQTVTPPRWRCQ